MIFWLVDEFGFIMKNPFVPFLFLLSTLLFFANAGKKVLVFLNSLFLALLLYASLVDCCFMLFHFVYMHLATYITWSLFTCLTVSSTNDAVRWRTCDRNGWSAGGIFFAFTDLLIFHLCLNKSVQQHTAQLGNGRRKENQRARKALNPLRPGVEMLVRCFSFRFYRWDVDG